MVLESAREQGRLEANAYESQLHHLTLERQRLLAKLQSQSVLLLEVTPLSVHGTWYHDSRGRRAVGSTDGTFDGMQDATQRKQALQVFTVMERFKIRLNDKLVDSLLHESEGLVKVAFSPYWIKESANCYWTAWNRDSLLWHLSDRIYWYFASSETPTALALAQVGLTHPQSTDCEDSSGVPESLLHIQQNWLRPIVEYLGRNKQLSPTTNQPTRLENPLESLLQRFDAKKSSRSDARVEACFLQAAIGLHAVIFVSRTLSPSSHLKLPSQPRSDLRSEQYSLHVA